MIASRPLYQLFCIAALSIGPAVGQGHLRAQIQNLVTFGDSFTDTFGPTNGGTQWPTYVSRYANLTLYPYARGGATCSNKITPRPASSVFDYQLPTYYTDSSSTGSVHPSPASTLYTLWIGTNDLGVNALLTGSDTASLVDVTKCMADWVQDLYNHGARNFLFQNMVPLEKIPLYAPDSWPNRYWNKDRNTTEWSVFMRELILSGNELVRLRLQVLAPTLPDAHVGIFDSYSLFADMHSNPQAYLNGTAPLSVDTPVSKCVYALNGGQINCTLAQGSDRDSYLWFDELHPSEQADRIVAREVAQVAQGQANKWTTWLS